MPIYEYQCHTCENVQEHCLHITQHEDSVICSTCFLPLEKLISAPGSIYVEGGASNRTSARVPINVMKEDGTGFTRYTPKKKRG